MAKLVTIYGGSGFVGRYIAQRMAGHGWHVRAAVRRPGAASFMRDYGDDGQVEPVACNIRDDLSVREAATGADAVVNCVGTFDARGSNNFDAIQAEGPERVGRIASELGVSRVVHVSAIGADIDGESLYAQTKGRGEAGLLASCPDAVILRPSVVFGPEDQFFNRFAGMARTSPVIPLVGADTKFQPVYVDDLAHAAELGILGNAEGGTYELGGPDVLTFHQLIDLMLDTINRKRVVLPLPFPIGAMMGKASDVASVMSGGLLPQPITSDQVRSLRTNNVVSEGAKTFSDLGITPAAIQDIIPTYLAKFRPSGAQKERSETGSDVRQE